MKKYILAGALCLAAAPALADYSSIALSPNTGAWGKAHNYSSRSEADNTAVDFCRQHTKQPDDCRVVNWAKGGWCAAVAVHHKGDGSVIWGASSGPTLNVARAKAYDMCMNQNGSRCESMLAEVCSN